ncbi:MAG TPA: hypothetical protein VMN76_00500, partial [Acidobacteriota bacterium]|nr:hypothetical protein [Acidobacteriota bacterium]
MLRRFSKNRKRLAGVDQKRVTNRGFPPSRLAAFILLCSLLAAGSLGSSKLRRLWVESDYAPLQTAIVVSIGDNLYKFPEIGPPSHPFFSGRPPGIIREHEMLAALLKEQGVEVLDVLELLEGAIVNAR